MADLKLSELLAKTLDESASKTDVSNIVKKLIDFVKEAKKKLEEMHARHEQKMAQKLDEIATQVSNSEGRLSQRQDADKDTMYSESRTLLRLIDEKIEEVKALIPNATDLSPLEERIAGVQALIPSLPDELSPEGIRNKLELYAEAEDEEKIDPRSIRGLAELIEEVKKLKTKAGGSSQLLVNHWPIHESFTMDGVATTVTLQQAPAAQGTAIFGLRYQGQNQVYGTDYTVNGNKITFVSFVPEADTIIDISYMP